MLKRLHKIANKCWSELFYVIPKKFQTTMFHSHDSWIKLFLFRSCLWHKSTYKFKLWCINYDWIAKWSNFHILNANIWFCFIFCFSDFLISFRNWMRDAKFYFSWKSTSCFLSLDFFLEKESNLKMRQLRLEFFRWLIGQKAFFQAEFETL